MPNCRVAHFQLLSFGVIVIAVLSAYLGIPTTLLASVRQTYDAFRRGFVHYELVIGIVSARENFQLRQALRNTWLKTLYTDEINKTRVLVKFIIGSDACEIPPALRQNEYECELLNITDEVLDKELQAYEIDDLEAEAVNHQGPLGQDFQVNRDIVITRLGVFDSGRDGIETAHLKVKLYDTIGQDEIVSVTFNSDDPGILIGHFRFKVVEPYVLPKDFKGTIVAENFTSNDTANTCRKSKISVNTGGGVINFRKSSRYGLIEDEFPVFEEVLHGDIFHYIAGNFMYVLHESSNLKKVVAEHDEMMEDWKRDKLNEETKLKEEISNYSDILLVNEIDVYRNIPKKIIYFNDWLSKYVSFDLLLKTDDDCYIDVNAILQAVNKQNLRDHSKIWWSQFRRHWEVNHYGKWTDLAYTGKEYPAFACGSGYVVSADIVHWIASNSMHLYPYQGEDISMGIWLAALNPLYVVDPHWQCGRVCQPDMYSMPDNTAEQLHEIWRNKVQCGDPCGCV